jgi:hypothetical protein
MELLWGTLRDDDDDDNNNNNNNISVELLSGIYLGNDRIKEYDWEQLRKHGTSNITLPIINTPVSDTKHILK